WTKRFNHPSEFTKVGEDLDVVVLDINLNDRKLTLGHKQIEEDPWDTFETIFQEGSLHEGTINKREDNGAIVLLPYGLEGFAPTKHLTKEDGKLANADETLTFKVIEFDRKDKKLIVSHRSVVEDMKREQDGEERKEKVAAKKATKTAVKSVNKQVEKTTLGDLSVLSSLKDKMEASEKGGGKKAAAKKAEDAPATEETPSVDESSTSEEAGEEKAE